MDMSQFKPYHKDKFSVGTSIAVIGRSMSGKSTLVENMLSNFDRNFSIPLKHCKIFILLHKAMQPSYNRLMGLFPSTTRKILARSVDKEWLEPSWFLSHYTSEQDFALILYDDQMEELARKKSAELELLSSLMWVGLHHSRCILVVTLQSLGTSETSSQLRVLLKNFSVFVLMSGLTAPTVRYLSSFLSPGKSGLLVGLMAALPRRPGAYLVVDDRYTAPHRFSAQSILCSQPNGQIYMVFE